MFLRFDTCTSTGTYSRIFLYSRHGDRWDEEGQKDVADDDVIDDDDGWVDDDDDDSDDDGDYIDDDDDDDDDDDVDVTEKQPLLLVYL